MSYKTLRENHYYYFYISYSLGRITWRIYFVQHGSQNPVKFNSLVEIAILTTLYVPLPLNVLVYCHTKVTQRVKPVFDRQFTASQEHP